MGHTSKWTIHLYGPLGTHLCRHRQSGLHMIHSHNSQCKWIWWLKIQNLSKVMMWPRHTPKSSWLSCSVCPGQICITCHHNSENNIVKTLFRWFLYEALMTWQVWRPICMNISPYWHSDMSSIRTDVPETLFRFKGMWRFDVSPPNRQSKSNFWNVSLLHGLRISPGMMVVVILWAFFRW